MRAKYIWVSIVLAMIAFSMTTHSCKDNPPCIVQCDSILEAHPDAFQFLIFPKGSWWEYELLDSEEVDTLILFHNNTFYTDNYCVDENEVCKFNYDLAFRHTNIDYNGMSADKVVCRTEFFLKTFNGKDWVVQHSARAKNNASMGHFLNFPFFPDQLYSNDRFMSDTSKMIHANGLDFQCIEITALKGNSTHEHRIIKIYLSRGVGIVRDEYQNGHIWQLKSHFINH
jgi:hypothetical protein